MPQALHFHPTTSHQQHCNHLPSTQHPDFRRADILPTAQRRPLQGYILGHERDSVPKAVVIAVCAGYNGAVT
jgi:hypothetical protein